MRWWGGYDSGHMGRKHLRSIGVLLAALALGLWLVPARPSKAQGPAINWSAFDQVKVGMTRDQPNEYDSRRCRIRTLIGKLERLQNMNDHRK